MADAAALGDDHTTFIQFEGMPALSRAAVQLHTFGIVNSIQDGRPGFVSDDYLNAIAAETTTTERARRRWRRHTAAQTTAASGSCTYPEPSRVSVCIDGPSRGCRPDRTTVLVPSSRAVTAGSVAAIRRARNATIATPAMIHSSRRCWDVMRRNGAGAAGPVSVEPLRLEADAGAGM